MSYAHAPNGLLVDPIYAKMRCRPLCVSPPPTPVFTPPGPPVTQVDSPPQAPSAYTPEGLLVQDNLPPVNMITASDGAIDVFLQVLVNGTAICTLEPGIGVDAALELNVAETDILSVVAGVAMYSYADRILTHYQPYLEQPAGAFLLEDRSGQGQHYDWVEENPQGQPLEITTNTVNGPNGTTSQTRVNGGQDEIEGRWEIGATLNTASSTDPYLSASVRISMTGWEEFSLEYLVGIMGTGPTSVNGQTLTINGPLPEALQQDMTAILSNTCGDGLAFPLSYDTETDTLTGTLPTTDPSYRFLELRVIQ